MTSVPKSGRTQSPFLYLYTQVAASHLGDTAAVIISALISHGRLTAKDIHRHTNIPVSQVKTALVGLVQLRCVQHWQEGQVVHYLFAASGIWTLIHAGDMLASISTEYGAGSAEVAQHVLENGSVHIREYMSSIEDVNAQHETMQLLVSLYNNGWLCTVRPIDYQPASDVWRRVYNETLHNTPRAVSETRRIAEATEKARLSFEKVYEGPNPLQRVNGLTILSDDTTIAINLARYEKRLRSRALVELARSRVGLISGAVYAQCCTLIEAKSPEVRQKNAEIGLNDPDERKSRQRLAENLLVDRKATVFLVHDIVRSLATNLDLRGSIMTKKRLAAAFKKPAKRVKLASVKEEDVSDDVHDDDLRDDVHDEYESDEEEAHSISLVTEHLKLLTSSTIPFLQEVAPGSYTVPFLLLIPWIKRLHYDTVVKTTMGTGALRVLNCVRSMKLADEKAIAQAVLMRDRTVKSLIFRLVLANVLDIQEVPRSADRAALKTFYLFRHKLIALYRFLTHALAFCMADVVAGIGQFRLDHAILLDKCAREDVQGHEEELLTETELANLRALRARETACVGRFNRVKWLYSVFAM